MGRLTHPREKSGVQESDKCKRARLINEYLNTDPGAEVGERLFFTSKMI